MFAVLTASAQGFKNPVLPGFHADPSVCRAGDDFYLVNSTFQYFPGVPVFHSKDLIHWEQVGNCLTRHSQVDLKGTDGNSGIYAPTIRYHEGRFYMVTTVFPSRRHFYVWTDNPAGEWSEPIVIDFAIGSCDPTLFWDEGKCYFLWKEGDIKICEIDVETGKQLGEIHHLGTGLGGRYPEGPHIYKKDGWYYLLLAEGGTEHGHHVNILRSKSLFGPYEPNPANPILSHFNMKMQNSPIQGLGHADLIQASDDSWWMICLGYRTSGYLQHVMGRETMLAPVEWADGGWPVVNGDGTLQIDMQCKTLPQVPMAKDPVKEEFDYIKRDAPADSYHSIGLPMGWMSLCAPDYSNYSLTERKGFLRLRPSTIDLSETANPTFISRRQTELNFTATTLLDLSHFTEGMLAGITAYAAPLNHYDVVAERRNGKLFVKSNVRLGQTSHCEKELPLSGNKAYLRITSDKDFYYMQASSDCTNFTTLAKMEYRFLSTETIGGFTGVMLGLFAQCSQKTNGYVDIDWFEYNDKAQSSDAQTEDTLRTITADMAYEGVNNYCHSAYDWSVAKDNPDIMYLTMGEETDSTYQVVFRSYTGAFIHFYVNKASGTTRMVEKVPSLNVEEDAGTIDLFDYLPLATEGTQELKVCPFQLDDFAKFASELDTIIETLKNKEK